MTSRSLVLLGAIGASVATMALLIAVPPLKPRSDPLRLELRPGTRLVLDGTGTLVLDPEGVDDLTIELGERLRVARGGRPPEDVGPATRPLELRFTAEGLQIGPRVVPLDFRSAQLHVRGLRVSRPE